MMCIYATDRLPNGCKILNIVRCNPDRCMWKKTAQDYLMSLHKARLNYIRQHGKDEYISLVPPEWRDAYKINEASIDEMARMHSNVAR